MKTLLHISLIFLPIIISAQKGVNIEVQTISYEGKAIPGCELLIFTLINNDSMVKQIDSTDRNGYLSKTLPLSKKVEINVECNGYYSERKLINFSTYNSDDTIQTTFQLDSAGMSIYHGFYDINFDSYYTEANITELPDQIKLYETRKYFEGKNSYSSLLRIEDSLYQIHHYQKNSNGKYSKKLLDDVLSIKEIGYDLIKISRNNLEKDYYIIGYDSVDGFYVELIKE